MQSCCDRGHKNQTFPILKCFNLGSLTFPSSHQIVLVSLKSEAVIRMIIIETGDPWKISLQAKSSSVNSKLAAFKAC